MLDNFMTLNSPEIFSLNKERVVLLPELFVQLHPVPLPSRRGGERLLRHSVLGLGHQVPHQVTHFLQQQHFKNYFCDGYFYRIHQMFI